MNFVYPIKEKAKIQAIKDYLAKSPRDLLMFTIGLNSALRISDILSLTVGQVKSGYVVMKEQKTKKTKRFPLNTSIMDVLVPYIADKSDDEYLFASRSGGKPISRIQAYRIIKDASKKCGLKDIATHSMRKSLNIRELIHICNERLCANAQKEIRELVRQMSFEVSLIMPFLEEFLQPKCEKIGYCPEFKSCGRKKELKK